MAALSRALADLGVGWYVFGAQAVVHWGRPRLTEDIDVTVQLGTIGTADAIERLQRAGFAARGEDTPDFIATRVGVPSPLWAYDGIYI
ncbi:MAG: hypothetical protein IT184_18850 [Acidobacteria bacterium]|nr:hypothetical protein [Acidobacteriota bacterium]